MGNSQQPAKSTVKPDDLSQIKGVGQATVHALNQLGIFRFLDFQPYTSESLSTALKSINPGISSIRIDREDWLGQARALSAAQAESPQSPPEQKTQNKEDDWHELSNFIISFGYAIDKTGEKRLQTDAYNSKSGRSERWENIATRDLVKWMLSESEFKNEESISENTEKSRSDLIEILNLKVSEIDRPVFIKDRLFSFALKAEYELKIGDSAFDPLFEESPLTVDLHLVDVITGKYKLASTQTIYPDAGAASYLAEQDFPPLAAGEYRLYLSARMQPPGEAFAQVAGPIIRVEG